MHNTVYLPASYSEYGDPSPVLYYLHGTAGPSLIPTLNSKMFPGSPLPPQAPAGQAQPAVTPGQATGMIDFSAQRHRAHFLVVAPDTDPKSRWCQTCLWIDGNEAPNYPVRNPVPAESFLYEELFPLIESVYNTRNDRGGRGIAGFSMGGSGALIQGMRHPDKFRYIGSVSGPYDLVDEPLIRLLTESVGYLRDQGYGSSFTHTVYWRNFNPADLVGNLAGQDIALMLSAGDGCPGPPTTPACEFGTTPFDLGFSILELALRYNIDRSREPLAAARVPATQVRVPGRHGTNVARIYAETMVPEANRAFANNAQPPEWFSYRTVDTEFTIFGYAVSVTRGIDEFLGVQGNRDARVFHLIGRGAVRITTPTTFAPGREYLATVYIGKEARQRRLVSNETGRLRLSIDLGEHIPVAAKVEITG